MCGAQSGLVLLADMEVQVDGVAFLAAAIGDFAHGQTGRVHHLPFRVPRDFPARQLLTVALFGDGAVTGFDDGPGMKTPRRFGSGGAFVVMRATNSPFTVGGIAQYSFRRGAKFRFFKTRPMLEWSSGGIPSVSTTCFSSSLRLHLAWPSGGLVQASAIRRASMSPVTLASAGGVRRFLCLTVFTHVTATISVRLGDFHNCVHTNSGAFSGRLYTTRTSHAEPMPANPLTERYRGRAHGFLRFLGRRHRARGFSSCAGQ